MSDRCAGCKRSTACCRLFSHDCGRNAALLGVEALLASRSLAGSLRRTSVLVGALVTAIAMMAAVGIMVGSFRQTVLIWMDDRLQADLYLAPPDRPAPTVIRPCCRQRRPPPASPGSACGGHVPSIRDQLPAAAGHVRAAATRHSKYRPSSRTAAGARMADRLSASLLRTSTMSRPATYASWLGGRTRRFRVLDIYYDYANERGYVIVDRRRC